MLCLFRFRMCLLFIYTNPDAEGDGYSLVLVNVRDEFFHRPTKPADFWENAPHIIGGKDRRSCDQRTFSDAALVAQLGRQNATVIRTFTADTNAGYVSCGRRRLFILIFLILSKRLTLCRTTKISREIGSAVLS